MAPHKKSPATSIGKSLLAGTEHVAGHDHPTTFSTPSAAEYGMPAVTITGPLPIELFFSG
jgi:hypothetical protein